jgi:hypothetical protein
MPDRDSSINMSIQQDDSLSHTGGLSVGGLDVSNDTAVATPPKNRKRASVGPKKMRKRRKVVIDNENTELSNQHIKNMLADTWACAICTLRNTNRRFCAACDARRPIQEEQEERVDTSTVAARRLTQEEQERRDDANTVAARANEDLSKDAEVNEMVDDNVGVTNDEPMVLEDDAIADAVVSDEDAEVNGECVSSSPKDDESDAFPAYTATDPNFRKRACTLRESAKTHDPFRTPDPTLRKSAPDLASKRRIYPTPCKLFEDEESTPPTTIRHFLSLAASSIAILIISIYHRANEK